MLLCDPGVTDTADIRNVTQIYFTRQKGTLPLSSFIHFWIFLKQLVLSVMYQVQIISTCWLCPTQHKVKSAEGLLIQRAYVEVSIASLGLLLWAAPWALFFTWAQREAQVCRRLSPHASCNVSPLFLLIGPPLNIVQCAENQK